MALERWELRCFALVNSQAVVTEQLELTGVGLIGELPFGEVEAFAGAEDFVVESAGTVQLIG